MRCRTCRPLPEEVAKAADLLGRRWMLAILWVSAEEGAVRFNEFKQALEGIPPRTLAARLLELEDAGVLERRVLDTRPPRVEYRLTVAALHSELTRYGLVAWTAGNVSARVPGTDLMVIKPSGVSYEDLTAETMIVCDLDGMVVEGDLAPSSDTAAHAYVYRAMPEVGGVVHTHSTYATAMRNMTSRPAATAAASRRHRPVMRSRPVMASTQGSTTASALAGTTPTEAVGPARRYR